MAMAKRSPWLEAIEIEASGGSAGVALFLLLAVSTTAGAATCPAERSEPLLPADPDRCVALEAVVRDPSALPLAEYEARLGEYLRHFCHRRADAGWLRDKRVRDTGPFTAAMRGGEWSGTYHGTHAPVVVWYSPEMVAWLDANRGEARRPVDEEPVPDGAILVKEMYPAPAALCAEVDPLRLLPTSGAAVMVRDRDASRDGWYWGWFGWSGWDPDDPPDATNRYPYQGFGQYCLNCHASARGSSTFASLANVEGRAGEPLVFLSQHFFEPGPVPSHHRLVRLAEDDADRLGAPHPAYDPTLLAAFPARPLPRPTWETVRALPSQTYDNTWVGADGPTARDEFVTSSQCLGCHDAGSTGLQFDMTRPNPHTEDGTPLWNLSPYATWRTSPMGLGGRDPIFYAQLASEVDTFHPQAAAIVQNTCLGCHGVAGQRQLGIDRAAATGACEDFLREYADAVPYPADGPSAPLARYGALARDGISCTACHRMLVGQGPDHPAIDRPENRCVAERQHLLNPDNTGFAKTFTGSFLVGPPDRLVGPFEDPKTTPMRHALGIEPAHDPTIRLSETCGTCHTVHLPVMADGTILGYTYEQTTYPEWAFSAYRTGESAMGSLPGGAGAKAQSCQACHMRTTDADDRPLRSKIASIQERSSFPQVEHGLSGEEIDLPVREGFAKHTLVGLNVFLIEMAQQFPDVLGIRTQDPMLVSRGLDPLLLTEQEMLDQASSATASVTVEGMRLGADRLTVDVAVTSEVGHKLPSGVGFRRAFLELSVVDDLGSVLWASGRTDRAGRIVDAEGRPVAGEVWWRQDCSSRLHPDTLVYQPHYQTIARQDQAQIYQELVTAPPDGAESTCGLDVAPRPPFTTSFLSICAHVKDNRILPHGFLPLAERVAIAGALGAGPDLARDSGPHGVDGDPDYVGGGGDRLRYAIDRSELAGRPVAVVATLYYQAIPPYYLEDRFCTSRSEDTQRLYFLAGHLNLDGTAAESWKLEVASTGPVAIDVMPDQATPPRR